MSPSKKNILARVSASIKMEEWRAVNTPSGLSDRKLDEVVIGKMTQAVHMHYKIPTHADREENLKPEPITDPVASDILDAVVSTLDVFILEKAEEFKYGKGKKVVAIADGGQNYVGNTVKYVKWFNLYDGPERGLEGKQGKVLS
jgi:hypothetical protein